MPAYEKYHSYAGGHPAFQARSRTVAYAGMHTARQNIFLSMLKNFVRIGRMLYTISGSLAPIFKALIMLVHNF